MQVKTIKSILNRKMRSWWDSIEDVPTRELAEQGTIVTGGAITSLLLNEPVNDYDVYFKDDATLFAVASYYLKKFRENPPVKFLGENKLCVPIFLAASQPSAEVSNLEQWRTWKRECRSQIERGIQPHPSVLDADRLRVVVKSAGVAGEDGSDTYQYFEGVPDQDAAGQFLDDMMKIDQALGNDLASPNQDVAKAATDVKAEAEKQKLYRPVFLTSNAITLSNAVQLVVRFYGSPEEIHGNYDFEHCKCYWTSWDHQLVTPESALLAMMNRQLIYSGSRYPVCSVFRAKKFVDRGWKINAGQLFKMCMQISQLNLQNIWVLEDQLIGVDTAFFQQVIMQMRDHMEKKGLDQVDTAYLMELISRIF